MGGLTWKALGLVLVVGCIALVACMGLGIAMVASAAIVATFLVLTCMAVVVWVAIAFLEAWGKLRAWWACVCRKRRARKAYAAWVKANPDARKRIHMNGPGYQPCTGCWTYHQGVTCPRCKPVKGKGKGRHTYENAPWY